MRGGEQAAPWARGQGKRMLSRLALTAGSESEDTPRGDSGVPGPGVQFLTTADSCASGFHCCVKDPKLVPLSRCGEGLLDLG